MLANLLIADRLAPEVPHRWRARGRARRARTSSPSAPYQGRIRVGVALFFALIAGVGVSSQWQEWILFTNRVDFGVEDPQFHKDVGFYVFQLPFLRVHHRLALRRAGDRAARHRGRALPQRRHPVPEPVPARDAAGQGAPLGDPRRDGAREDGAVLLRPLRARTSPTVASSTAPATPTSKAQLPALNLLIFISIVGGGAVHLEHLAARLGAADHRGRALGVRVARRRDDLSRPSSRSSRSSRTSSQSERAVHRAQHRGDAARRSTSASVESSTSTTRRISTPRRSSTTNLTTIDNARLWDPAVIQVDVPDAPGAPDLLPDRRRRRRPLRRSTARPRQVAAVRARAQQRRAAEPVVGERAPRVHARLRRRRVADERAAERRQPRRSC